MQTAQRYYTPEEYLKLEEAAEYKSEYLDGQIVPMAGGSTNHNRIAGNLYAALNFAFRQQNYEVFITDVRLWIPDKRFYTYPDVMVTAGEPEYYNNRTDTITDPQVIIEVFSDSTQGYDREEKISCLPDDRIFSGILTHRSKLNSHRSLFANGKKTLGTARVRSRR